jgi:NhaA family Na+:H+ antiporter
MATDIAFALGVLQLMGPRCPVGLKIFLTALAIIDDMGAIIVIALFYTDNLSGPAMLLAAIALAVLVTMNKMRARRLTPYLLVGAVLWLAVLGSGIHATIAGVLLALTIPVRTRMNAADFPGVVRELLDDFERLHKVDLDVITNRAQQDAIHGLQSASMAVQAPLLRLEHALGQSVAYGILPLFALANAGVSLSAAQPPWAGPVGIGVLLGLLLGKPIGITLFSLLSVKTGLAALPHQVSWGALHGAAWLGGIGFTMALFIASLAFAGTPLLDEAKLSILLASVLAGIIGRTLVLRATAGPREPEQLPAEAQPSVT